MTLRVVPVSPVEELLFEQWNELRVACARDVWGEAHTSEDTQEMRDWWSACEVSGDSLMRGFAALNGDRVVGAAWLELPQLDNTHRVDCMVDVAPEARRRGAGTALVEAVRTLAVADGRTVLSAYCDVPDGAPDPGAAFAAALGWRRVLVEARSDLELATVDDADVQGLLADAEAASPGYHLTSWTNRIADRYLADRARLAVGMSTDVPIGDMDFGEEVWDEARVRRSEDVLLARGRRRLAVGAVHTETDRLVAHTEILVGPREVVTAHQWDTIVAPDHRGHRLGMRIKAANLLTLREASPETVRITTWNAEVNDHMLAIGTRLGFRRVGADLCYELGVGPSGHPTTRGSAI